jgi:acetylxylan esterase
MAATYPELFAAGSLYSGVAAGCFMSNTNQVDGWNSSCADGDVISTPQYWASVAENMYPGYTGSRPKMQIYHGSADTTLYPPNYNETCKQWAGVFGYNYNSPQQVISNDPQSQYFTTIWGPNLQGIYAIGVGHTVPIHGPQDMEWFGFAGGSTTTTTTTTAKPTTTTSVTSTKTTSSTTTTTTTGTSGCAQVHWDQCGGIEWQGCTVCASPYTCQVDNPYYSQCL